MNRDEIIGWLVENVEEWPIGINTDVGLPDGCYWYDDRSTIKIGGTCPSIEESDWNADRIEIVEDQSIENSSGDINDEDINTNPPPSKYHVRNIWQDEEWLDFYTVWDAIKLGKNYQVGDSAIEHAIKKGFAIGERSGGKSRVQDLKDMIWSLERAVELIEAQE